MNKRNFTLISVLSDLSLCGLVHSSVGYGVDDSETLVAVYINIIYQKMELVITHSWISKCR
jgi:hypothetical protein